MKLKNLNYIDPLVGFTLSLTGAVHESHFISLTQYFALYLRRWFHTWFFFPGSQFLLSVSTLSDGCFLLVWVVIKKTVL